MKRIILKRLFGIVLVLTSSVLFTGCGQGSDKKVDEYARQLKLSQDQIKLMQEGITNYQNLINKMFVACKTNLDGAKAQLAGAKDLATQTGAFDQLTDDQKAAVNTALTKDFQFDPKADLFALSDACTNASREVLAQMTAIPAGDKKLIEVDKQGVYAMLGNALNGAIGASVINNADPSTITQITSGMITAFTNQGLITSTQAAQLSSTVSATVAAAGNANSASTIASNNAPTITQATNIFDPTVTGVGLAQSGAARGLTSQANAQVVDPSNDPDFVKFMQLH